MVRIDIQANNLITGTGDSELVRWDGTVWVRMTVGKVDLLGYDNESDDEPEAWRWYRMNVPSVAGMARWGLVSLQQARTRGRYVFEIGTHGNSTNALLFKMSSEDGGDAASVLVHSTMVEKTVQVGYEHLVHAWRDYGDRVRLIMAERNDELINEPNWKEWLSKSGATEDAEYQTIELFPFWQNWFAEHESCFERIDASEA